MTLQSLRKEVLFFISLAVSFSACKIADYSGIVLTNEPIKLHGTNTQVYELKHGKVCRVYDTQEHEALSYVDKSRIIGGDCIDTAGTQMLKFEVFDLNDSQTNYGTTRIKLTQSFDGPVKLGKIERAHEKEYSAFVYSELEINPFELQGVNLSTYRNEIFLKAEFIWMTLDSSNKLMRYASFPILVPKKHLNQVLLFSSTNNLSGINIPFPFLAMENNEYRFYSEGELRFSYYVDDSNSRIGFVKIGMGYTGNFDAMNNFDLYVGKDHISFYYFEFMAEIFCSTEGMQFYKFGPAEEKFAYFFCNKSNFFGKRKVCGFQVDFDNSKIRTVRFPYIDTQQQYVGDGHFKM